MKHVLAFAVASALAVGFVSAEPTTKPTTKPITKPVAAAAAPKLDKDSILVNQNALGARYVVSRTWDVVHEYASGGTWYAVRKAGKNSESLAEIEIEFKELDNPEVSLADNVKARKAEIQAKAANGQIKYIKEEATKLGGEPGLTATYDLSIPFPASPGKKPEMFIVRHIEVYGQHANQFVRLSLNTEAPAFEMRSKMLKRVVDSFQWVPVGPSIVQMDAMRVELPVRFKPIKYVGTSPTNLAFRDAKTQTDVWVSVAPAGKDANWSETVLASIQKKAVEDKHTNTTFGTADGMLGDTPAKVITMNYVYHSGCGYTSPPFRSIDTVAVKNGKLFHVTVNVNDELYAKDKAAYDALASSVQWQPTVSAMAGRAN
jgi:hypothetical protein